MNRSFPALLAVALLSVASSAFAQGGVASTILGMDFDAMDMDDDGMVSEDEFMAHQEEMFSEMDHNQDGMIDEDEQSMMMEGEGSMEHDRMMEEDTIDEDK